MSEKENMLSGLFYDSQDAELLGLRQAARRLLWQYNATDPAAEAKRAELTQKLFGRAGQKLSIEPPFFCDYGFQIFFGDDVFVNFNCIILDCARVDIGDGCRLGPNVQIYTATHPLEPRARKEGKEFAAPVKIGKNVWIGGGAIILPGVSIGDNATIGAGAVVTKDIPALSVAVGNPARVRRQFYDFKKDAPSQSSLPAPEEKASN